MMDKKKRSVKKKKVAARKVTLDESFIAFFCGNCKQLNFPTPKFIVYANAERKTTLSSILTKCNSVIEINLQCDATDVKNPLKLECKGYKLPMLILDTVFFTANKFKTLTTLSLINCGVRADGIAKIATSVIETGYINDINLDMNPNSCGNHYLLCSRVCKLQYLSLKFCNLGDSGVEKIANELKYRDDCDLPNLVALNLAHNRITDVGAISIAKLMLHTNRSIQSMNLSGNWITDTGALSILSELYMFPLTHEEIVELRKRKYARLMQQEEKLEVPGTLTLNVVQGEQKETVNRSTMTKETVKDSSGKKNRSIESQRNISGRSSKSTGTPEQMSITMLDLPELDSHPFTTESYPIKGEMMSTGNLEPQHLNLSYNQLTTKTLKEMVKCVYYHSYMMLNDPSRGLLHVNLEGNDIPEDDELWAQLRSLLSRCYNNKDDDSGRYESLVPVESKILRSQIRQQPINK